mmetsp:Transcript_118895/g.341533  ORF Transcript_118895/g.341533 Transcript_118895/m.341533 type:complete len:137 (-) Transcript_118895:7-417(-)
MRCSMGCCHVCVRRMGMRSARGRRSQHVRAHFVGSTQQERSCTASSASTWCVAASPPEPYVPFQGCTVEDFSHTLGTEVRLEGPLAESVGNAWRRAGVEPEIARNGRAAIPDSLPLEGHASGRVLFHGFWAGAGAA